MCFSVFRVTNFAIKGYKHNSNSLVASLLPNVLLGKKPPKFNKVTEKGEGAFSLKQCAC